MTDNDTTKGKQHMGITKRIDTKNSHWYKLDGEKVDGVTTILNQGMPKPALPYWAAGAVAEFAATHLDLLADLELQERVDLLKGAPWRDRDKAAKRGTEVHRLAEALANGKEVEVPEELVGHVDSYLKFLDDWQVQVEHLELVVVNRRWRYMGSLDLIGTLSDGQRWLLDIKTSRSGIFPETAMQIAGYRNAETYLDADGKEQAMPAVDACGAVWVRADGYDLVPVDAGPTTFKAFLYVQQVARWANACKQESPVGDVLVAPKVAA